jgi:hypothetical protein
VIPIYRGSDYIEAHLLTGLLRQRGIDVFLQGALLQGGIGDLPALGHLTIMVDAEDRVAAERIIAAYERGELQLDEATMSELDAPEATERRDDDSG